MITVLILILANGVFAMAEIAVVAARKVRLQQRAETGDRGAQAALALANHPDDFLSTVQIGITLIGILMGAIGEARIASQIQPYFVGIPVISAYSREVSLGLVVVTITLLTLVLGELVPKQIGLSRPEYVASRIAQPMQLLARVTAPLVRLLSLLTNGVTRLLRLDQSDEPPITEAELQSMLEQGTESGVFEPIEEEIVEQLFRVGDQRVNDLMIDRIDIVWLDLDEPDEVIRETIINNAHSRYPVARGNLDNIIGLVFVKDLLTQCLVDGGTNVEVVVRPALFVPSGLPVYDVLERFKEAQTQIAFVIDEHGGIEGLVTFNDLLEAIVGDVPEADDPADPVAVQREDGSWLIDGKLAIDEFKQLFDIHELPEESSNYYQTLGGFVMMTLGRVPQTGDSFSYEGLRYEVVDMDWRRVDKIMIEPVENEAAAPPEGQDESE